MVAVGPYLELERIKLQKQSECKKVDKFFALPRTKDKKDLKFGLKRES